MNRRHTAFVCRSCGHREPKWLGQCPACGEWNTLEEQQEAPSRARGRSKPPAGGDGARDSARSTPLDAIATGGMTRMTTGIPEFDRALGGGLVPGATVLIGGEPGIGKSTLMAQAAGTLGPRGVLYVSGEEAAVQIRKRAERIGSGTAGVQLLCTNRLAEITAELHRLSPAVVIVDSIQTIIDEEVGSVPGTPNQVRFAAQEIADWARRTGSAAVLVAHVTKEGSISGPRVIEHLVDTVLFFEHSGTDLRYLRAGKNRFGAIEEVGLFSMSARGLVNVTDPARVFASAADVVRPAGVVVAPCFEGSRVLMVEIQALTVPAKGAVSRTFSDRIDARRVTRVAAVLEKHVGVRFNDLDLYVNVAGGLRIADVGVDVPLAVALYSARAGKPIPGETVAVGELSLAGQIRTPPHLDQRIRTAADLGFVHAIRPPEFTTIREAIESLFDR